METQNYEYVHRPGYGRDDHMADEIIARAARILGLAGAGQYVQAATGMAPHPVPMGRARVSLPSGLGVRARMEAALREARTEVVCRDCAIEVVLVRRRRVEERGRTYRVVEHRRGRDWIEVERSEVIKEDLRL